MTNARIALFTTLVLVVGSARVGAQVSDWRVTITRAEDLAPIAGAEVRIPELQRSATSDIAGGARIADVPTGRWLVQVRRLGYSPLDTVVDLTAGASRTSTFALQRAPQPLDTTTVTAKVDSGIPNSATIPEFEARRARATGRFLTAAQLRKEDDRNFVDVLRSNVPGVAFEVGVNGVRAYNTGQLPPGSLRGGMPQKCYVQVVIDGNSIYQFGKFEDPPDLTQFLTRSMDGVEYYSSPSRTPPELRSPGAVCGTLVFWTRRR